MHDFQFSPQTEAGHVFKVGLNLWQISASCSYELGSYKKKCVAKEKRENESK